MQLGAVVFINVDAVFSFTIVSADVNDVLKINRCSVVWVVK